MSAEAVPHLPEIPTNPPLEDILIEPNAQIMADHYRDYYAAHGKFIRVGDIVLVAPLTVLVDPDNYKVILHRDMLEVASHHPDSAVQYSVHEASKHPGPEAILKKNKHGLVDAGYYSIEVNDMGTLSSVAIYSSSAAFGRAGEAGRDKTTRLVQDKLGPEIIVQAS